MLIVKLKLLFPVLKRLDYNIDRIIIPKFLENRVTFQNMNCGVPADASTFIEPSGSLGHQNPITFYYRERRREH